MKFRIPFLSIPDEAITNSTQSHILFADITDNLVLYKTGGAALVLESTSLNFGLLSLREQQAVISGYAAILNSLTFPIQIVVSSQRKNITKYVKSLEDARGEIENIKLQEVMVSYQKFITDSIRKKNVLSKSFFIIIPFTQYELGLGKSVKTSFFSKQITTLPYTKPYVLRKAKITLYPKRDHIVRQGRRLGLQLKQLTTDELIRFYFNMYNPMPPVKDKSVFGEKK